MSQEFVEKGQFNDLEVGYKVSFGTENVRGTPVWDYILYPNLENKRWYMSRNRIRDLLGANRNGIRETVNDGKYLVEKGLATREKDGRSYTYELTNLGKQLLEAYSRVQTKYGSGGVYYDGNLIPNSENVEYGDQYDKIPNQSWITVK